MSERMVPFHCPYCGDESLHPHGPERGSWECRSCLRAFTLQFVGHLSRMTRTVADSTEDSRDRRQHRRGLRRARLDTEGPLAGGTAAAWSSTRVPSSSSPRPR